MEAFGSFAKVCPHTASLTQNILLLESGQIKPSGVMLMYIMCNLPGWLLRWSVGDESYPVKALEVTLHKTEVISFIFDLDI